MNRKLILFVGVLALSVALVACSGTENESNRQVITVSSMNLNSPFFSDVLDQGDTLFVGGLPYVADDFLQEDWVPVTFYNRPYSGIAIMGETLPHSDFLITRYRVEWRRADGGPATEVPPTFEGATSVNCPINEFTIGHFLIVPFEFKNSPLLSNINYLNAGFPDEIMCIATFTFWGHEIGTDREWSFPAELSVNFADPVVRSDE